MIITNFKTLAKTSLRKKALQIIEAGYEAIEIQKIIGKRIKLNGNKLTVRSTSLKGSRGLKVNLNNYKNIFIIGIGKGLLREAVRAIQDLRKEAGLSPKDKINLWLEIPVGIRSAIEKNISEFKEKICAKNINFSRTDKFDAEAETKMDGVQIWAGIKRI